jgi:hypothetical protein
LLATVFEAAKSLRSSDRDANLASVPVSQNAEHRRLTGCLKSPINSQRARRVARADDGADVQRSDLPAPPVRARLTVGVIWLAALACCTLGRSAVLGFWFEPVTYGSARFGERLTSQELQTIERIARSELFRAFGRLPVTVSDRQDARYRVRVLQHVRDPRFRSDVEVAGASRALSGLGGDGAVNFSMLAAYAESYAPPDADRPTIVAAIGRGVGRAAVHEFTHQLLGSSLIDRNDDAQTYEHGSADRREQYYGDMRWGDAWPALQRRFGVPPPQ